MEDEKDTLKGLVSRAKSGDRAAFDMLYNMYASPLYRYVFIRMRNREDTEDIVQETFLKAYQALPRYREERDSMLPYLFTIARNLLINHGKKKRPDSYLPDDIDRFAGAETTSEQAERADSLSEIREAMKRLTETEQEVIELRFFGERSYAEIAEVLGKREDAVRQHVARAMKKMKEAMKDSEPYS